MKPIHNGFTYVPFIRSFFSARSNEIFLMLNELKRNQINDFSVIIGDGLTVETQYFYEQNQKNNAEKQLYKWRLKHSTSFSNMGRLFGLGEAIIIDGLRKTKLFTADSFEGNKRTFQKAKTELQKIAKKLNTGLGRAYDNERKSESVKWSDGKTYKRQKAITNLFKGRLIDIYFSLDKSVKGFYAFIEANELQLSHMGSSQNPEVRPF